MVATPTAVDSLTRTSEGGVGRRGVSSTGRGNPSPSLPIYDAHHAILFGFERRPRIPSLLRHLLDARALARKLEA